MSKLNQILRRFAPKASPAKVLNEYIAFHVTMLHILDNGNAVFMFDGAEEQGLPMFKPTPNLQSAKIRIAGDGKTANGRNWKLNRQWTATTDLLLMLGFMPNVIFA